jgi:hypothetical protein
MPAGDFAQSAAVRSAEEHAFALDDWAVTPRIAAGNPAIIDSAKCGVTRNDSILAVDESVAPAAGSDSSSPSTKANAPLRRVAAAAAALQALYRRCSGRAERTAGSKAGAEGVRGGVRERGAHAQVRAGAAVERRGGGAGARAGAAAAGKYTRARTHAHARARALTRARTHTHGFLRGRARTELREREIER